MSSTDSSLCKPPTRPKNVYGLPRPIPVSNPNPPSPCASPPPITPFLNRKSIQEQLAEIDRLADDELLNMPLAFSQDGFRSLGPTSSQPEGPGSLTKSAPAGSPSTNGPSTPCEMMSLPPPQEGRKRLRVVESDEEEVDGLQPDPVKHHQPEANGESDDDSLPDITFDEIDRPRDPKPESESTATETREKKRAASESGSEETIRASKKPKSKKIKSLNKREKESIDRHLAALTREKDVKLVGTCKQPTTSLDAMLAKLAQSNSKSIPKSQGTHQTGRGLSLAAERSSSSIGVDFLPLQRLPTSSGESIDEPGTGLSEPADNDDEDLPEVSDILKKTIPEPVPVQSLAARKQAWVKGKAKAIEEPSDSDSDLEIVDLPASSRLSVRTRSNAKPVVTRSSAKVASSVSAHQPTANERVMAELRQKCEVESARERMRKQREFGLVDKPKANPTVMALDIKGILKSKELEDEAEDEQEEEEDQDWIGSGSELGSVEDQEEEEEEEEQEEEKEQEREQGGEDENDSVPADPDVPVRRKVLRVVESPEPEDEQEALKAAVAEDDEGIPGFGPSTTSLQRSPTAPDSPLPGFGPCAATGETSPLSGFQPSTAAPEGSPLPGFGPLTAVEGSSLPDLDPSTSKEPFSQLFDDGDDILTHPPPPLLLKPRNSSTSDESFMGGTCVLPAVNVLPEERERDLVAMMLAGQDQQHEEEEEPIQYVNHRGLLTQNKPALFPPDSPLLSQDWISRTPFALRKEPVERPDGTPCGPKSPTVGQRLSIEEEEEEEEEDAETVKPKNVFTLMMQNGAEAIEKKKPGLDRRLFVADQADESDEDEGMLMRGHGGASDDEDESDSDAARSLIEGLVDDGADERDEAEKLEGELAVEELAKAHERETEARREAEIAKVVAGRMRKKQAGKHGGISDSDSEDEEEAELVKARQRAQQEQMRKNKKHKIHQLGSKHESFFRSYEESTTQWADPEDLACLQPTEEDMKDSDFSEEEEDDDDKQAVKPVSIQETRALAVKLAREQKERGEELAEEQEVNEESNRLNLDSSPVRLTLPKMKINDPLRRQLPTLTGLSCHADLDDMYDVKRVKLSDRQKALKVEPDRMNGPSGPSKSSSITYQHQLQAKIAKQKNTEQSTVVKQVSVPPAGGGLAKLKTKKKKASSSKLA
ncbi:hypothetical protein CROQUDRAFT_652049 [Cronartium quercuum f. sp. fusiforme G11]|uniref:DNA replication checkpoint mediator MRC1 domain-containing protein n=1 Tax=Cronartium quercuum f. sp. fusiforme G11 TaxID=708437 RepID=A0A9P6NUV4_9BASI|nr:hypothetical protein CROQUDRAFT_652049 [Cronartium quercuum f. sp. fusiforme G11]